MCRLPLLCALFVFFITPSFIEAQEWTRFRGEGGTGVGKITGLPVTITQADYEWAAKLEGEGHSSPVLWGKTLFVTESVKEKSVRKVVAFDSISGSKLWESDFALSEHNLHKHNNFASSTPVVSADALFVVWGSGSETKAIALNHAGEKLWERDWPRFSSDHGFGSSPILVDDVLVLHTDSVTAKSSQVHALNPATGETIWTIDRPTLAEEEKHLTAYNTPTAVTVNGKTMIVVLQTNDGWKGLSPATGEVLWEHDGNYNLRSVGSIASGDGIVFATFGSGGNGKMATALLPQATGSPTVLYDLGIADGLSYVPTPLLYEDRLYLWSDGGVLTCRNAKTGEEIYRERIGGNFFSSPIIADGKIYCGSRDGEFVAVRLGDQFKILGRSRLGSGMNATPAVAKNRLFLRTDTHLISVRGRDQ